MQKRIATAVLTMDLSDAKLSDAFFRGYWQWWVSERPYPVNVDVTIANVVSLEPEEIDIPIYWEDEESFNE